MIKTLIAVLSTSYIAWHFENHELAVVYPFDNTHATPAEAGAPLLSEVRVDMPDGASLVIWQAMALEGRPTVVYFPGNDGTLKDRATRFARFVEAGFGVVAPAYRGSSGSTGTPEESLLIADAEAVTAGLSGQLILYGESLGAAIAIRLAASGLGDAVVLEAPFTSLVDLISVQYPMEDLSDTITQRWESLSTVGELEQPLMVIHGEEDRLVPFAMGEAIFQAAGSKDKIFYPVAELGHNELWTRAVHQKLFAFMARDFSQ